MSDPLRTAAKAITWGACPLAGVVTAGQPTAEQFAQLKAAGLRTVVDLRGTDEDRGLAEAAALERLGLRYIPVPITPDTLGDEQFDRVRAILNDAAARPVLIHCRSANRSGAVLYPWLVLDQGTDAERAFDLACAVGLRNPAYAELALTYVRERT